MSKFENFIYTNDEALSEEKCNKIIDFTNKNMNNIVKDQSSLEEVVSPQEKMHQQNPLYKIDVKNDFSYHWSYAFVDIDIMDIIQSICSAGLVEYAKEYPAILKVVPTGMINPDIKYHIVRQRGGYHAWHSEWDVRPPDDRRILTWHISLTSHENEGELEFLYHDNRISPKAGRLVIWPAFFPWLHRGNAIRTDTEKHYLTGWFYINH